MAYNYPIDDIKKKVTICLVILFKKDSFLLQHKINEKSIAHKLAEYLQTEFLDWNVDCEYNRKGLDVKILENIRECSKQRKTDRVYPDIIVHRRNTDDNLLVVEIKVDADDRCDIEKLKLFTSPSGNYKYQSGLFIKFNFENEKPSLRWFKNGQEQ